MGQSIEATATAGPGGPANGAGRDQEAGLARAYAPGERFVALVYRDREHGTWRPRKVFIDPQQIELSQTRKV